MRKTIREEITEDVSSSTALHLLIINKNLEKLLKDRADIFHLVTAKFLYIVKIVNNVMDT